MRGLDGAVRREERDDGERGARHERSNVARASAVVDERRLGDARGSRRRAARRDGDREQQYPRRRLHIHDRTSVYVNPVVAGMLRPNDEIGGLAKMLPWMRQ